MRKKKILTTSLVVVLTSTLWFSKTEASNVVESSKQVSQSYSSTHYFKDVKKTFWAAESIKTFVDKGFIQLYSDGSFKPNSIATREEAACAIARAMGISLESDFNLNATDVPETHPYYKEIRKLAELGIIQNNSKFNPKEPLNRAHISKMLANAFEIEVDQKNTKRFKDYPSTFWAKDIIESLADVGVINGTSTTTFSPNNPVSRVQLVELTKRAMDFQDKVENLEVAYDYLAKDYISTTITAENWAKEVVSLVNVEREKHSLAPLQSDEELQQLAIIKAQDMIKRKYFDHDSPFYGLPWDMATLFDYQYTSFGENIARNFNTPKEVVAAWMASEKHRSNILKQNYTNIGIGIKKDRNGKFYWVQLFSSK
ncbi:S-layer homology domain-containing protein [Lysinibacillus endophyticus]|uniref:CAP and S-layer homology domain-containing protein n=1 Tax=Ureibacillus endophyticus TaxID=1978490 RepID=UPI0031347BC8